MRSPADDGIAGAKLDNAIADGHLDDDDNPRFLFSGINTCLLVAAANGEIDLNELARAEMANRGLGRDGKWIGFNAARKLYENYLIAK